MDRSKTVELMPIMWRLGTGRTYADHPKAESLRRVRALGAGIIPLPTEWTEHECFVIRTGAATALGHIRSDTDETAMSDKSVANRIIPHAGLAHGGSANLMSR